MNPEGIGLLCVALAVHDNEPTLTCPCGQYDYIGSSHDSNKTMKDILLYHRRQSVRILHEFLLGEKIIQRTFDIYEKPKSNEEKKADRQYLYRHLTECSVAIQFLLNCSFQYWPFIPMDNNEADEEEWCLANVRLPMDGTRYSRLQLHHQARFFKQGYDLLILPHRHLDIFNLSIVFLLPEDFSSLLCQVIETLLITHGECKLNTHGHLLPLPLQQSKSIISSWHKNLVGRHYSQ